MEEWSRFDTSSEDGKENLVFRRKWIRNVSPMWENPNIALGRLKLVKNFFRKIDLQKNEKLEIEAREENS